MGQRQEQRIAVSFGVVVRGLDRHGNPFQTTSETHDISCSGACLTGLSGLVEPGSRIEVEYREQRAWYRVQWVDNPAGGTGRAGVRCLEPGRYIWGVPPKGWAPDTYDPSHPDPPVPEPVEVPPLATGPSYSGADRRQFPRVSCRIEAQVAIEKGSLRMPATVTDISLGGCYLEMLAPLPVDSLVEVLLKPGDVSLQMSGKVRSSQTGMGMGIAFTGMRPEDFEKLQKLAPPPANATAIPKYAAAKRPDPRPAAAPPPSAGTERGQARPPAPRSPEGIDPPATPEAFQAVVRLLFRKGLLTREELKEELEKLKPTRV